MGTVITIEIGNYGFISEKNTFGDLLLPFSPTSLYIEEAIDESGRAITKRYFSLSISQMKDILDYTGHTLSAAQNNFEHAKENIVYISREIEDIEIDHQPIADEVEQFYSFDEWRVAVNKYALILANDIFDHGTCKYLALEEERKKPLTISEKMVMDTLPFGYFGLDYEDIDRWNLFRVIIEAFPDDEVVTLDYTELFEAGWCNETPSEEEYCSEKTIILTEGKFDAEAISESLQLLYPHMSKFFSFVDFDTYRVQGSTNFVTHYFTSTIDLDETYPLSLCTLITPNTLKRSI